MPTLVEYLATFPGRMFLLISEDPIYTLHNTVSNDYVTIAKMEAYSMADCDKIMTLIRDNENWEVQDEKWSFDVAERYLMTNTISEIPVAVQTDLNPDIYLKIVAGEIIPYSLHFYLKADDTETYPVLLPDFFSTNNWSDYPLS